MKNEADNNQPVPGNFPEDIKFMKAALKQAEKIAADNLAAAEVRAAMTASGFVAILNAELTERIDLIRDTYASDEELAALAKSVNVQAINALKEELAALKKEVQVLKNGK